MTNRYASAFYRFQKHALKLFKVIRVVEVWRVVHKLLQAPTRLLLDEIRPVALSSFSCLFPNGAPNILVNNHLDPNVDPRKGIEYCSAEPGIGRGSFQ